MKLSDFIVNLRKLQEQCDAEGIDPDVYFRHGDSGEVGELSYGRIDTVSGDETMGPWDVEPGTRYVAIYAGS